MFHTLSLASHTEVRVLPCLFLIMTIRKTSEPHPALDNDINSIDLPRVVWGSITVGLPIWIWGLFISWYLYCCVSGCDVEVWTGVL